MEKRPICLKYYEENSEESKLHSNRLVNHHQVNAVKFNSPLISERYSFLSAKKTLSFDCIREIVQKAFLFCFERLMTLAGGTSER